MFYQENNITTTVKSSACYFVVLDGSVYLLIADIADSLCYNFQDYGYAKRKLFHVKHLQFGGGYECYEFVSGVCAALLYFVGIAADLLETAQRSQFALYFGQSDYLFYDFLRAAVIAE